MRKRRQRWLEEQARKAEQQEIWDSEVKAQQDWNNKAKAEQIADARYVLSWSTTLARAVSNGTIWITEAIQMCKRTEAERLSKLLTHGPTGNPEDSAAMAEAMKNPSRR